MNTSYLSGTYDIALVGVSYLIACLAAYAAIDMVQRIRDNREHEKRWLILGAVMMGCGIWTMHFIGMQSFSLPFELNYDTAKTVLSLIAAIAVALLALWASSRQAMGPNAVIAGALLMASASARCTTSECWRWRSSPASSGTSRWSRRLR